MARRSRKASSSGRAKRTRAPRTLPPETPAVATAYESCACVTDLEAVAKSRLPSAVYDYYAGGAEDEQTLAANREAFRHVFLRPRALVGVGEVDPSTTVLGTRVSMPVLIAPTAYQRMAHEDGELATARAAGAAGTLMVASTIATYEPRGDRRSGDRPPLVPALRFPGARLCRDLIQRAEAAGYGAICLTVDTPCSGGGSATCGTASPSRQASPSGTSREIARGCRARSSARASRPPRAA